MIPYLLSLKPALCGLFHIGVKLGVMVNAVNRIVASPFLGGEAFGGDNGI